MQAKSHLVQVRGFQSVATSLRNIPCTAFSVLCSDVLITVRKDWPLLLEEQVSYRPPQHTHAHAARHSTTFAMTHPHKRNVGQLC